MKTRILKRNQIIHFLKESPDEDYLQVKALLHDPESFTGHGMRRSFASLLPNAVKHHSGWKSTTVAESYIEESLSSKMAIAEKNPGPTMYIN
ncbi:hypothetical protein NQ317_013093 [Molorchus minor]|uniref:Uncharacterized protein n=1 Tax=Molorchus minor TaxID=1323400 RepID=A0ABQ9IQ85_9CUCU|nr:hypothetical protein NQ317_013093 [Molorchus minor]